jgi:hypothetical protein
MTTTPYQVHILDSEGNVLKDVDATSTMDAMAYYLVRYGPNPALQIEGDKLAAQVRSSYPTSHSESPTADFVVEERSVIAIDGVKPLLHQFIARVHS